MGNDGNNLHLSLVLFKDQHIMTLQRHSFLSCSCAMRDEALTIYHEWVAIENHTPTHDRDAHQRCFAMAAYPKSQNQGRTPGTFPQTRGMKTAAHNHLNPEWALEPELKLAHVKNTQWDNIGCSVISLNPKNLMWASMQS